MYTPDHEYYLSPGILETRVDEVREKSDGFGLQIEKLQNPNKKE